MEDIDFRALRAVRSGFDAALRTVARAARAFGFADRRAEARRRALDFTALWRDFARRRALELAALWRDFARRRALDFTALWRDFAFGRVRAFALRFAITKVLSASRRLSLEGPKHP